MAVVLKEYLKALERAVVKPAPPWPKNAREYMEANGCKTLLGWYDGPDEDGNALIYLNLKDKGHRNPEELIDTASEEIVHHLSNGLNDPAAKAVAVSLLGYSRWRAAVSERLLALLLR